MSKCEGGEQLTKDNCKVGMSVRLTEDQTAESGNAELGAHLQNNVASRACASFSNGVASRAIAYF